MSSIRSAVVKIVLDIESIRPPLTGIGRYTLTLARELVKAPQLNDIRFITHGGIQVLSTSEELEEYVAKQLLGEKERAHVPFWRLLPFWEKIGFIRYLFFRDFFIIVYNGFKHAREDHLPLLLERLQKSVKGGLRGFYYGLKDIICRKRMEEYSNHIFHGPNNHLASALSNSVVTIHDVSVLRFPDYHPADRVKFWEKEIVGVSKEAAQIITVSEFQRQEIIELLDVKPEKVNVVYLGVESKFQPYSEKESKAVLEKHGLKYKQYSLIVSTVEPRKNFERLLQAFTMLPASIQCLHPLVIIGDKGWESQEIHDTISELAYDNKVVQLGYVDEQELPLLYSAACVFLYPSLYEGFGLPVLEAMASGTAVITSNTSSLPEVAGDSCLLVDPYSVEEIAMGWERLLKNDNERQALSDAGLKRSKLFTWKRCAEQTIEVYKKVV